MWTIYNTSYEMLPTHTATTLLDVERIIMQLSIRYNYYVYCNLNMSWCLSTIWDLRLFLFLALYGQNWQEKEGSLLHSYLRCCCRFLLYLYTLWQASHGKCPLSTATNPKTGATLSVEHGTNTSLSSHTLLPLPYHINWTHLNF